MVLAHPAGLIHEYPKDAMLFFRARRVRSSSWSAERLSPVEVKGNAPRPEVVALGALRRGPSTGWFTWEEGEEVRWEREEPNQSSWD